MAITGRGRGTRATEPGTRRGVDRDIPVRARDGTRLLVDHHWPRPMSDVAPEAIGGTTVWVRTAYGRRGGASFAKRFTRRGAHVLVEALRGTDGSEGHFDGISIHHGDGGDVAAWLREQAWFPGSIVTAGPSFLGTAQWALAHVDVPEWRLAILQDCQAEARRTMFPGGVFNGVLLALVHTMHWQREHPNASMARMLLAEIRGARRAGKALADTPLGTADERLTGRPAPFFREWLAHVDDEAYWEQLNLRPNAARLPGQVLLTSGWYDTGLASTLPDHAAVRDAGKTVRLVIGPWYHGQEFTDRSYTREIDDCVEAIARGDDALVGSSVRVHVGGDSAWRDVPSRPPPARATTWHLQPGGGLSDDPPPASPPDRYRYDPADPTPSVGGAKENWDGNAGARDNRALEGRDDVLTYTSAPLTEELEVIGPVGAEIALRSSLEHTDLFARLCDVDPRGRSVNLCDGIRRLRPGDPPAAPDGTRRVPIDLVATAHRFRAGHRIRLQVSSGAHPRLVRNTGSDASLAEATDLRPADQEVFHDPQHPSVLTLPVTTPATAAPPLRGSNPAL